MQDIVSKPKISRIALLVSIITILHFIFKDTVCISCIVRRKE